MGRGRLGAQQGMQAATAQQTEEAAILSHPKTTQHIADHELKESEKIAWLQSIDPTLTNQEAKDTATVMLVYSEDSGAIHKNNPDSDPETEKAIHLIDRTLTSHNAPIYKGEIYRGVTWYESEDALRKVIKSGTWTEAGITSFSSDLGIAKSFAEAGTKGLSSISVVIRVPAGKNYTGVPFMHMSNFSSEKEVLVPSTIRNRGYRITKASWTKNEFGRTEVYLDAEENLRRSK